MKSSLLILLFVSGLLVANGQSFSSPAEFLGYELGESFTRHHRLLDYFEHVAENSAKVEFMQYGASYEGRPLVATFISSPENIKNLEQIRLNNLINAGFLDKKKEGKDIPIVWLSYNIHGDEAVSSEAAMKTLYSLVKTDPRASKWLEDMVIIIDPCLNPDGRDRYANWYNGVTNHVLNTNPVSIEHNPPWPGGRTNHYLFDLNRDWAWQVQVESEQRGHLYHDWMPQVHVDFHEMGIDEPYFFAPAAKPYHQAITGWQSEFQELVGKNNADYFEKKNWLYFTSEVFDLFYPSYGDTWPIFNGAIGFTYEMGGSRRAGKAIINSEGDSITLAYRIAHHHTTGLSTIETAYNNKERLLKEFKKYFKQAVENPYGKYQSFVIKRTNSPNRIAALLKLLDKQMVQYGWAKEGISVKGFDYMKNANASFRVEPGDIVVNSAQPQNRLVNVLFEPHPFLEDSLTYDLTAWALPYVYGLECYAAPQGLAQSKEKVEFLVKNVKKEAPYAYVLPWDNLQDIKLMSALHQAGVKVRFAQKPFQLEGLTYKRGTLVVTLANNRKISETIDAKLHDLADKHQVQIQPIAVGQRPSVSFGSSSFKLVEAPSIALVSGEGISQSGFGELWYFFDREIKYPTTIINQKNLKSVDLAQFDVIILAGGSYSFQIGDALLDFINDGGRVVALEAALSLFASQKATNFSQTVKKNKEKPSKENPLKRYETQERSAISSRVEGSIFKVHLDDSHPLSYGIGKYMHLIKRTDRVFPYLEEGWNVGTFKPDCHVSGFVGHRLSFPNSMAIGVENLGKGEVIYMSDSPIFRGFWYSGKLLMANAVFF